MNPIRRFLAGGSLGLALCASNFAADPPTTLAVQLERLRDDDYRVRESAARELIRLDRVDRVDRGARSAVWSTCTRTVKRNTSAKIRARLPR